MPILEPSIGDLMKSIQSRYLLVNVAAHRARQIAEEAESEGLPLEEKAVSIAIREIAEGKLTATFVDVE